MTLPPLVDDIRDPSESPRRRTAPPMGWIFYSVIALALGFLSLAPRGVEVTVRNETDEYLTVRVECRTDVAITNPIAPGAEGSAVVCPTGDTSIEIAFSYGARDWIRDLRVYTYSDAIGAAHVTLVADRVDNPNPQLVNVTHESGYSLWSLLPSSLFVRGIGFGLACSLMLVAFGRFRQRPAIRDQRAREAAMEQGLLRSRGSL